jgi:outer membrane biosynthesis protein TonB
VSGRYPPEIIQYVIRHNFGLFRACYRKGLVRNPNLQGRVSVRFVIGSDGSVRSAKDAGSDLPDREVVACVVRAFHSLHFAVLDAQVIDVVYPIVLSPN